MWLGNNNITDVESIGELLKTNNTLKELNLAGNNITDVQSIGEGLKTNNTLNELNLDNNNITDDKSNQLFLTENNPWVLRDISERLLEAKNRGLWKSASDQDVESLKSMILKAESLIEKV